MKYNGWFRPNKCMNFWSWFYFSWGGHDRGFRVFGFEFEKR